MLEFAEEIDVVYRRAMNDVGDEDPYAGQGYLGIKDVLNAHFLIADIFYREGSGLGGVGPRNLDLLHSAVHRQHVSFDGRSKWTDKFEVCATLFFGLVKDHPFHDANKRTAFLSLMYHLDTLGYCPTLSKRELEDFTVLTADDGLGRYKRYRELRARFPDEADCSVRFIARYLKKRCRAIDKRKYTITYRQLQTILGGFGYELQNPRNNTIDVVRVEERRKIFGVLGKREQVGVKVAQIGFPNWTAQVGANAIKTVRNAARLTADRGIDSQVFYKGADPFEVLFSSYREPLFKLANR